MGADFGHLLFELNKTRQSQDLASPDIFEAFVQAATGDQAAGRSPAAIRAAIDSNTGMMSAMESIT